MCQIRFISVTHCHCVVFVFVLLNSGLDDLQISDIVFRQIPKSIDVLAIKVCTLFLDVCKYF